MRISLNWLKEYIDLDGISPDDLAQQMTMLGLEIEAVHRPGEEVQQVVIGQILSIDRHPDADKIVVCKTDVGGPEPLQICCGATNMKVGDKVPTAVVGATLPGGFQIGRRKMRGVESQGMMCSARELGLGDDVDGLMILDPATPVGEDARKALGLDDVIFEIEVTPNRGDWASLIGVARELAACYGRPVKLPGASPRESSQPVTALSSVTVEDPERCPRYCGRVLLEVKVGPSPDWLQQRLLAAGQRPINNVVDITNFVLLETGQPLHAFDYDKLAEHRIVVRAAKTGENVHTLDAQERKLTQDMLIIADAQHAQCVAGVMGGAHSEVGEGTTRIFLESAYFNPVSIRRTSRALGLITESSQRFQRGADPEMAPVALDRAAALMQEIAGAEVAAGVLDVYPQPLPRKEVQLRYHRTRALLGAEVPPERQRAIVQGLGFELLQHDDQACTFRVPTWRHDIQHGEADLIEEIARLVGFDTLPTSLPRVRPSEAVFAPHEARVRRLRHFLVGLGLAELYNWTFSNAEETAKAGLDGDYLDMVRLQNPLSENYATLRSSLIPGLLSAAAFNLNRGRKDIPVFEIGPIYQPVPGQDLPQESLRLGILLSGEADPGHWSGPAREVDFFDLKGYAEAVLEHFGVPAEFTELARGPMLPGQTAAIRCGGEAIGHLGKAAPAVRKAYGLSEDVYLLELDLAPLLEAGRQHAAFATIPAFPPSLRDLAVVVDASVPAAALVAAASQAGGQLLKSAEVFDVYTGTPIPEGQKSVALNLLFQSPDRTLTDADTDKSITKIQKQLQKAFNAVLR